jgi:hypothetical protein
MILLALGPVGRGSSKVTGGAFSSEESLRITANRMVVLWNFRVLHQAIGSSICHNSISHIFDKIQFIIINSFNVVLRSGGHPPMLPGGGGVAAPSPG